MKVLYQPATTQPGDWIELPAAQWREIPRKPVPNDRSRLNAQPGWYFDLCIDGVMLYGFDHVAVEPIPGGVRAYGWVDDTADPTFTYRWGEVWEFRPHRPDPKFGGALNTHQVKRVYAEDLADMGQWFPQETSGGPVELLPWSQFPTPPESLVMHGVWVRDEALWQAHFDSRRKVDFGEWD